MSPVSGTGSAPGPPTHGTGDEATEIAGADGTDSSNATVGADIAGRERGAETMVATGRRGGSKLTTRCAVKAPPGAADSVEAAAAGGAGRANEPRTKPEGPSGERA